VPSGRESGDAWDRYRWVWHLAFALVLAAVTVLELLDAVRYGGRFWVAVAALAGIGVAYLLVGRLMVVSRRLGYGLGYFVTVAVLFGVAFWCAGTTGYLLFMLIPQVFIGLARMRVSVAVALVLFAMVGVEVLARSGATPDTLSVLAATVLVPAAFSVLIAVWIGGIIRQSRNRAELIGELERTREALAVERHEAGIRAERERLSVEIHDTLSQGFTSILMIAQAARAGLPAGVEPAAGQLDIIVRTARENLAEARALVAAMAPADLSGGTLADALHRLAGRCRDDSALAVTVTVTGTPAGRHQDQDVILLRAAQEALHNARRHADASAVHLHLSHTGGTVVLEVTDDGRGLDPATAERAGFGLRGIRQRAETSGGSLTLTGTPGHGTTLRVELPLPSGEQPRPGELPRPAEVSEVSGGEC
jgi:signal transduction histidine kinase